MVLDDAPTPIYKIPFPSVTICNQGKYMQHELNFAQTKRVILGEKDYSEEELPTADEDQVKNFEAMAPICNVDTYYFLKNNYDTSKKFKGKIQMNGDVIRRMVDLNSNVKPLMLSAIDYAKEMNEYFVSTLTEHGLCQSFNVLSEMINENIVHDDYSYFMDKINISGWSYEDGYKDGSNYTYPIRKLYAGKSKSLMMVLRSDKSFIDNECYQEPGFRVMIHQPTAYPTLAEHLIVPYNSFVQIKIEPKLTTTADSLRFYSPERRQCFYPHERKLKFFRYYNQHNCKLECLANIMLDHCGCVTFALPRDKKTRLCEVYETECYDSVLNNAGNEVVQQQFDKEYFGKMSTSTKIEKCNCMPPCTNVEYSTEIISNADINNVGSKRLQSEVIVYYKEPTFLGQQRKELYGFDDLVSNFGGLIGLFLGGSILSLFEIFFYCLCCVSSKKMSDEDEKTEVTSF